MERQPENEVHGSLGFVIAAAAAMLLLTGCTQTQPRSTAHQGVSVGGQSARALNASYYTGADPDFQKQGSHNKGGS
jgi:predicted component of type VI protein secretion system